MQRPTTEFRTTVNQGEKPMTRSKQSMQHVQARGNVRQKTDADEAKQSMSDVSAETIEQITRGKKGFSDMLTLAEELAKLRKAMKESADAPEQDISLGSVAAAEKAAREGHASATLEHLKAAG